MAELIQPKCVSLGRLSSLALFFSGWGIPSAEKVLMTSVTLSMPECLVALKNQSGERACVEIVAEILLTSFKRQRMGFIQKNIARWC